MDAAKVIEIKFDKHYGNWQAYPACEQAQLFAEIAGTKTLTSEALHRIKRLGFTIINKGVVPAGMEV